MVHASLLMDYDDEDDEGGGCCLFCFQIKLANQLLSSLHVDPIKDNSIVYDSQEKVCHHINYNHHHHHRYR